MLKIIISILVSILVYIILDRPPVKNKPYFKDKSYIKNKPFILEKLKTTDPKKPEKCFYDYELIGLHNIFASALSADADKLKRMKDKILPSICILSLVLNKQSGWDKFLDNQASKYGTDRMGALKKYLEEEYTKIKNHAVLNGLEFLTKPYSLKIEKVDPTTGDKVEETKEVNVLQELEDIIKKKIEGASL